jgi:hypothetical protein
LIDQHPKSELKIFPASETCAARSETSESRWPGSNVDANSLQFLDDSQRVGDSPPVFVVADFAPERECTDALHHEHGERGNCLAGRRHRSPWEVPSFFIVLRQATL